MIRMKLFHKCDICKNQMKQRNNGCAKPLSYEQIFAWIVQIISLLIHLLIVSYYGFDQNVTFFVWIGLFVFGFLCWMWCQLADPSVDDAQGPIPTMAVRKIVSCYWLIGSSNNSLEEHEPHYCAVCKKTIPGLDHHCRWLGICVGTRTYGTFYFLVLFGSLTFWIQTGCAIQYLSTSAKQESTIIAADSISLILSFPLALFYSMLFAFHTYLQIKHLTTYEFFLQRAVKKRAANRGQQSNAARDEGIEMSGQSTFNSSDKERNSDDRLVDASAISYNQNRGEP